MKKIILGLIVIFLLAGCSFFAQAPAEEDVDLSTRVAQILTNAPTSEVEAPFPVESLDPQQEMASATPTLAEEGTEEPTETSATKTPLPTMTPLPTDTPMPTATLPPTAIPPESDPRLQLGDPSSTDLFKAGDQWVWVVGKDDYSSNEIKDGYMLMKTEGDSAGWRLPAVDGGSNLYIEGTFRSESCVGKDLYGIMFRVPIRSEADRGYFFGVSCDGQYKLSMWDGKISKATTLVWFKSSDAILTGSNQTNRLGVLTQGEKMKFYINGYLVEEYNDATFPGGFFGVFIKPGGAEDFSYRLEEMSYWIR
ncbi:MAG: hypothetical protein JEZ00_07925 [Anaerolineaceae bacterium]|nr:hypothetical protein [Anaerolineaceae bacterium]